MNREDYLKQNAQYGFKAPEPDLIEDADGMPLAVVPSEAMWNYCTTGVTLAELQRVGLTPEDVPNLVVITPRRKA